MAYRDLCKPCAIEIGKTKLVIWHSGGINHKVTCQQCGRRRYGACYSVRSKGGKPHGNANRKPDSAVT